MMSILITQSYQRKEKFKAVVLLCRFLSHFQKNISKYTICYLLFLKILLNLEKTKQ